MRPGWAATVLYNLSGAKTSAGGFVGLNGGADRVKSRLTAGGRAHVE